MIYLELFIVFFTIGLFTIGGGYAMIPMIKDQVVGRGWMEMEALLDFFAIAESTPGPFAVNTATLVGYNLGGILGGVIATLGVILPSFLIILMIARVINRFLENKYVNYALNGIKPIVVGLISAVVITLLFKVVFHNAFSLDNFDYISLIIIVIIFALKIKFKKISPIKLIGVSALLGLILYGIPFLIF